MSHELSVASIEDQMKKVFRCPTGIAQNVSKHNIPDDSLAKVKAEQKEHKASNLKVQPQARLPEPLEGQVIGFTFE